ncbi:flagellar filament capping protein FliD [Sulfuricurvum sp. RIFCSPLOWO2_12_FULL_43_24]|uniref:flagellar filament capping protein FliD n=1 Tax=Sulfuricurvum sp. RIFCSPLOWO2_12_FULL_43_24 TaxID=1802247 RepID=UPI0008C7EBD6|nr:flagellar filament capping protein FliD [Sulfuricurvum sp. RIFCSPLOWO2_12_FULL_43_24]OHD84907.1 MAG: hypothetical protein A3D90_02810 [Sulfuricurvum sp. RIFCSPHIGHO2_02_FULL_43_9]OHD85540.1 MAG: hypothetical protein A3I60_02190 [Sulfuricurvum sp. RIFCSPLOWO2_02_FULL_43_45]OHD86699.1 MAG: hypothetical protein A2Y52_01245 [Sulfuricurvum sp. RIFCSPLOWO2_02_43_6]OHD89990.1 MAG: hypothetical protein A3G19_10165 [Sulfuricurvum sp. RIFCSPLOWO2_12_FULL_43_24]
MAGTINSLGIGSGVLTSDVIDKLKANDTSLLITPIDNKITLQKQKGEALDLLNSLLTTFKSSVSALDDDALYQKRSVSGNTTSVSVTATAGVSVQSFSISDTQLALKNVQESGTFASTTAKVSTSSGTMTLAIDGESFDIDYTSATTLDDLKNAINDNAGSKIKATTLQVGTNDYRLILTSVDTGADQTISISDSASGSLNSSLYATLKTIKSQAFSAPTDTIASGSGNLTIAIGTNNYVVNYDATTTLSGLATAINTAVGSSVASIDSNNKLVLQSTTAGSSTALTLTDNSAMLDSKLTAYTTYNPIDEIQASRDASFKYNGISISRSSNEITDIIVGVTINLLQESGSANVSISQDVTSISDEMSSLVQNYNTLTSELSSMTSSNVDAGTVGVFNGDSSINTIRREINKLMTSVNSNGYSLSQFGIDLSETGTMSFNSTTFTSKFNEDKTLAEEFLSGMTTTTANETSTVDGIFTSMNTFLESYVGSQGIMSTLTTGASDGLTALNENKTRSQKLLDARYEAMSARFIQYDAIMSRLTNQFSSLQQQIEMATNGN